MWACELSVLGIGPMPSPLFFSYLNEMTDNSPMLFEKKTKSCTRFINVDIGLFGSQVAGAMLGCPLKR